MILISYYFAIIFMATGIYAAVAKDNLIKKLIGLGIFTDGIHLLLITIGYKAGGIAPIKDMFNANYFVISAVDPIPQALVLTSIVIAFSVTALGLITIRLLYEKYKTTDARDLIEKI